MIRLILIAVILLLSLKAWSSRSYFSYMGRTYALFLPENTPTKNLPLLVLLHGCRQNATRILEGTMLEKEAQKYKFAILAPEQPALLNPFHCWNWFLGYQQERNPYNEMGQIVTTVKTLIKNYDLNADNVTVAGLSAGGALASSLSACYPDVFRAAAIHSGFNYKSAENVLESQHVFTHKKQKSPEYLGRKMFHCSQHAPSHRLNRIIVIHGDVDEAVPSYHLDLISDSQAVWRDYLDDGQNNDSVRERKITATRNYPNGYSTEMTDTVFPGFIERKILVKGLRHAWGGGKSGMPYFDAEAPSSNEFILKFFGLK